MRGPTQNLGLFGLAVLTFIGYKQTDNFFLNDALKLTVSETARKSLNMPQPPTQQTKTREIHKIIWFISHKDNIYP